MKNGKSTRKSFIVSSLFGGAAASLLPLASMAVGPGVTNAVDNTAAEKDLVFLFQGDSITDGNRGRNTDPNHIMGHGYAFAIAARIGADYPADGFSFYNRGVSGNTIKNLEERWKEDTLAIAPDVLSILIGINDVNAVIDEHAGALTPDEFENTYRQLINDALAVKPETIFVLGVPFVYPVGKRKEKWTSWQQETLYRAEKVKKLAKELNAVLVDYPRVFDTAITLAPISYWIWDGIHPTVPAHELMARAWIKAVSRRLPFLKKYVVD